MSTRTQLTPRDEGKITKDWLKTNKIATIGRPANHQT